MHCAACKATDVLYGLSDAGCEDFWNACLSSTWLQAPLQRDVNLLVICTSVVAVLAALLLALVVESVDLCDVETVDVGQHSLKLRLPQHRNASKLGYII